MDLLTALQAIKRTLEDLDIKATQANMDKLLGCMNALDNIAKIIEKGREVKANEGNGEWKDA
jgi:hypothetical protein